MHNTEELKKVLDKAKEAYKSAVAELSNPLLNEASRQIAAQRANDAWLEYKRVDDTVTRCLVVKKLGDLYGCY